jgi:peptidylprolyl isomerase
VKIPFLICVLCLALVAGVSGCGGDDATSSESRDSSSATTADGEGGAKADDGPLEAKPSKVVLGDYEAEGPFSAVSGQKGDKKPRFTPSGQPAPKKTVTRELEVGSGPAVKRGDEVSVYYAGADHATGKIRYYGWPPYRPATFQRLGFGTFGKSWEKTIEGMKVGGIRQVIITASYLSREPLDYVLVLTALRPQSEEP